MRRLDRDGVEAVHTAAVTCGFLGHLWDPVLLDGMGTVRANVPRQGSDDDTLRATLLWINEHDRLEGIDGPPLALWLANADRLADGPEGDVFRVMRRRVLGLPEDQTAPREALPFPPRPWPLLRPYTDARLFAGRDADTAALVAALDGAVLLGVYAPSGFGKSSALQAGLIPALRAQGIAAARDAVPHEPGGLTRLARRLGLTGEPATPDALFDATRGGAPPVLVLDQFEEIFKTDDAAAGQRVAHLLAAVAAHHEVHGTPPARVVLSYREEYAGQVERWLADGIGAALGALRDRYPHDLSRHFRAHRLPAVGETDPAAFTKALEAPLSVHPGGWSFADDGAERLAAAFAAAREADPAAPLVPELQVVLGALMEAADAGMIRVPAALDALIDDALGRHLRRHVDAIAQRHPPAIETRTRIWLGLRQLTTPDGKRTPAPVPRSTLTARLPDSILTALSGPDVRAVFPRRVEGQAEPAYSLSHDTLAMTVRALDVDDERRVAALNEDVFATERLIAQRVTLFVRQPDGTAHLGLDRATRRCIKDRPWLLDSDIRERWWIAAKRHAVKIIRRRVLVVVGIALVAAGAVWLRSWTATNHRINTALESIDRAGPGDGDMVLQAVHSVLQLRPDGPVLGLKVREAKVWSAAMAMPAIDMEKARRRVIRELQTVAETPTEFGYLVAGTEIGRWAKTKGRWSPDIYERERLVLHAALKQKFGEPPAELQWRDVPAGSFMMGSNEQADEKPPHLVVLTKPIQMLRHEVTRGTYAQFYAQGMADMDAREKWQVGDLKLIGDALVAKLPMWSVTWYEANALAAWLDPLGRLPSEAEWEYAAAGGPKPPSGWTDASIDDKAWHKGNSRQRTRGNEVHPVCELQDDPDKPKHPLDICDLQGNLYEWVLDGFMSGQGYAASAQRVDPTVWRGALRGLRGGSFMSGAANARAAFRLGGAPSVRNPNIGVRVVRPAPVDSGP